jgi:hypothetical protein
MAAQKRTTTKTKGSSKRKSLPILEKADHNVYKIMKEIIKADTSFEKIIKSCNNVTEELRRENSIAV